MRIFLPLAGLLAFLPFCVAEVSAVEASQILWYYTSYDLDFEVEGRNRTIARGCKGTGTDNKCNYNEFVNYILTGEPTNEPKYYEVTSDFSFYVGDVAAIIDQLRLLAKGDSVQFDYIVRRVNSAVGMARNLAKIADRNYKAAKEKKKDIERAKANMKTALSNLQHRTRVQAETTLINTMKNVKDLQVKTKERTSDLVKTASQRIDWRATLEANKNLMDRNTQTFKDVANAVRGHRNTDSMMRDRSIAVKAGEVFSACF